MIEEACQKREKLETNLKLRGLPIKEPNISDEQKGFFPVDLTTNLFISAAEASYKALIEFLQMLYCKLLYEGMQLWDVFSDLAVVELEFQHTDYASKAEKSWKLIASSLQSVLGCNVEIRINLAASSAKAKRTSFSLFSCSRRFHKSQTTESGSDRLSEASNLTSDKARFLISAEWLAVSETVMVMH
ncbi:hypothetical protein RND81_14G105900 [Saponaria officinalis]|uniref:STICHEL DnaA-N-like alpha-beta domain-containing protein n=1 Tax=Saponaria officinalis TaxID=3572 RepID=A0AAW1GK82_SAPOF